MSRQLTSFQNEEILIRLVNGETLVSVDDTRENKKGKRMLVAVHRDGFRTDYPSLLCARHVVYDFPEWFSRSFRKQVIAFSLSEAGKPFLSAARAEGAK